MQSNFEKVCHWNRTAGVETYSIPQFPSQESINLGLSLIEEELSELTFDGVCDKDLTAVADAIGDLLYVVYGFAYRFGINADKVFNLVHTSNMSKFCITADEVNKTIEYYRKKEIETDCEQLEENLFVIRRKKDGKILKSINFHEPTLEEALHEINTY